ncbi:hypothetical protein HYPSUDRAFT_167026 [Hypholoma sublateritium FD-334 SS-4]|uniref:F-box domain-containing protein n=1 Tax=Hypholoma sublateritium (strain FD-334 SS-4) TaxID=945553 RepID=A0A0D2MAS3_HYPSF|nr:hypothetical protein HYPSUDRAFT_167026 [Hypholoma sublateritium FD-334 SS-4]
MDRFSALLKTNRAPTSAEMKELTSRYQAPMAKLQQLDDKLLQLKFQIDELNQERELLRGSIDQHCNLLSPFRCLPDDVLHEIFQWCLPTAHESLLDISELPLLLGYVCRRWRTIAYQTPALWASLHVAIPVPGGVRRRYSSSPESDKQFQLDVAVHQDAIKKWISRSRQLPLSISLSRGNSHPISLSYLDLVLSFSARLHHLEVDLFPTTVSQKLASLPASAFPNLRTLVVKFDRSRLQHKVPWKSSGLLNAPYLSGLRLFSFPLQIGAVNINWTRLTRLDLVSNRWQRTDFDDARKIFTSCPRLTHCSLTIHESRNIGDFEYAPLSLLHLHTLMIVDNSTGFGGLFKGADIPALRHLTYHNTRRPAFDRPSALLGILSQTHMRLERLTTDVQFITYPDLLGCLELLPHLTYLSNIRSPGSLSAEQAAHMNLCPMAPKVMSVVLEILTPCAGHPLYLPALQHLHVNLDFLRMEVSDQILLDFIERRMEFGPPVAPLAEVRLISEHAMQIDISIPLSRYIADGLKLHLEYGTNLSTGNFSGSTSPMHYFFPMHGIERFTV